MFEKILQPLFWEYRYKINGEWIVRGYETIVYFDELVYSMIHAVNRNTKVVCLLGGAMSVLTT